MFYKSITFFVKGVKLFELILLVSDALICRWIRGRFYFFCRKILVSDSDSAYQINFDTLLWVFIRNLKNKIYFTVIFLPLWGFIEDCNLFCRIRYCYYAYSNYYFTSYFLFLLSLLQFLFFFIHDVILKFKNIYFIFKTQHF